MALFFVFFNMESTPIPIKPPQGNPGFQMIRPQLYAQSMVRSAKYGQLGPCFLDDPPPALKSVTTQ